MFCCKKFKEHIRDWDGKGDYYIETGSEYATPLRIKFCPFCGKQLKKTTKKPPNFA